MISNISHQISDSSTYEQGRTMLINENGSSLVLGKADANDKHMVLTSWNLHDRESDLGIIPIDSKTLSNELFAKQTGSIQRIESYIQDGQDQNTEQILVKEQLIDLYLTVKIRTNNEL